MTNNAMKELPFANSPGRMQLLNGEQLQLGYRRQQKQAKTPSMFSIAPRPLGANPFF